MLYMESKGFVHRDLRTVNVFVGAENVAHKDSHTLNINLKVGDFGLARQLTPSADNTSDSIYYTPECNCPDRWTAPECSQENGSFVFTTKVRPISGARTF